MRYQQKLVGLTDDQVRGLSEEAKRLDVPVNIVIRLAVDHYLRDNDYPPPHVMMKMHSDDLTRIESLETKVDHLTKTIAQRITAAPVQTEDLF